MNKYKHSGAFGDLIYSLALVKHLGPGDFYLHLNQINWIGRHYYGSDPAPYHRGRLTEADFNYMQSFMLAQPYINSFECLTPASEITHNLDRFRPLFVGHPGNYIDIYCAAFGIHDQSLKDQIRNTPWLTVPETKSYQDRNIVINRTQRWVSAPSADWQRWKSDGLEGNAVFVGLPDEYQKFLKDTGVDIPHVPTASMLELAQYIAGARLFIGNQSMALSLAIGLGVPTRCEVRRDLPADRNECYFPNLERVGYF